MNDDPGVSAEVLFRTEPQPLTLHQANLVVSWSPKSACSHVVLWSFLRQGLFQEANRHHAWPHRYRLQVYYRAPENRAAVARLLAGNGAGQTLLKVTRDPAARLVSIFRHVCRYGLLAAEAQARLGIDVAAQGLSLRDLDTLLEQIPLGFPGGADPHLRIQHHPSWDMAFDRTITLNMDEVPLNPGLNAVERALGLPVTNFKAFPKFAQLRETHYAREGAYEGAGPIEDHRFRAGETATFPKRQLLASPLLARMAARHYRADTGLVAASDTAGEIFAAPARTLSPA